MLVEDTQMNSKSFFKVLKASKKGSMYIHRRYTDDNNSDTSVNNIRNNYNKIQNMNDIICFCSA